LSFTVFESFQAIFWSVTRQFLASLTSIVGKKNILSKVYENKTKMTQADKCDNIEHYS